MMYAWWDVHNYWVNCAEPSKSRPLWWLWHLQGRTSWWNQWWWPPGYTKRVCLQKPYHQNPCVMDKAVQCTYPLLFFAASSCQGQGLLSFITWLVLDCLYHLLFFQFFPGLRVRGTGMHCCREGYSHVGAKRTKSCLWNLNWITVKGQFHWSQWVFWTSWLLEMVGWRWLSM